MKACKEKYVRADMSLPELPMGELYNAANGITSEAEGVSLDDVKKQLVKTHEEITEFLSNTNRSVKKSKRTFWPILYPLFALLIFILA